MSNIEKPSKRVSQPSRNKLWWKYCDKYNAEQRKKYSFETFVSQN